MAQYIARLVDGSRWVIQSTDYDATLYMVDGGAQCHLFIFYIFIYLLRMIITIQQCLTHFEPDSKA